MMIKQTKEERAKALKKDWETNPRWKEIRREYKPEEVVALQGTMKIEYSLAKAGAEKLWNLLHTEKSISALGALSGNQAVQEVAAGLKAIYLSGWQVAADANLAGQMYPDQSLYPVDSVPMVVKKINNAFTRADQIQYLSNDGTIDWFAPIVADAEAGFGGNLNAFELMKDMIAAGAAAVHFEDQLASAKKCGHMGGKVLVPINEAIKKLIAARLAADVCDVPTLIVGRTDADSANLLTSDIDPRDEKFIDRSKARATEGFWHVEKGLEQGINRALSYAPYCELIWMETSNPDIGYAREFAQEVRKVYPNQMLAYNCSPSFNWAKYLSQKDMATFRETIADMGYKFQFITLAGFHCLNTSMFELSKAYKEKGMAGYSELQEKEFRMQKDGFRAVTHQTFVGTGYFDSVQNTIMGGEASTTALKGSTESEQFH
ncbi:hypothetical protein CHS0354_023903 [Potamilus streckersoni]|uniref:isocitrate lyase n=1 Tax=Potamilus streckersoni TaxID=2493646 RepID=A0AAE0VLK2_9BIVA|nr:hypothetical protein CHS0354_023903 [Potamilus streckersoni]